MKNWIIAMLSLSILLSGCARVKKWISNPPAEQNVTPAPVVENAEESQQTKTLPDFASMSFVEKNNFYMQLLTEKINAGADISVAEDAYQKSLEASLAGNSAVADETLEEAILILWNL